MSFNAIRLHHAQERAQLIEQEARAYLSRLNNLFSDWELNLYGTEPLDGTFPAKVRTQVFWQSRSGPADQREDTPAIVRYLQTCLGQSPVLSFDGYMCVWADSFYATRCDRESARDILLGFLYQSMEILKDLYILSLPHNRNVAPTDEALNACLNAPENGILFIGSAFATWVLDEWLPSRLRHYHEQNENCREKKLADTSTDDEVPQPGSFFQAESDAVLAAY